MIYNDYRKLNKEPQHKGVHLKGEPSAVRGVGKQDSGQPQERGKRYVNERTGKNGTCKDYGDSTEGWRK